MNKFLGRSKEVETLRDSVKNNIKGILIYGQRQVGKSTLIEEAFSNNDFILISHECVKGSFSYNMELLAQTIANTTGLGYAKNSRDLFELLAILESMKSSIPIVVALDEYQYLRETQSDGIIDSYMQRFIDSIKGNITLLLCGSYITVMKELLEYENPLFSRLKVVIPLTTFDYLESSLFYPNLSIRDKIAFYSVFGGYPFILDKLDEKLSLKDNIKKLLLTPYDSMKITIENVLLQEVGKTGMPIEVLSKIGNSKMRYKEIQDAMANDVLGTLDRILKRLISMGIIEKVCPINRKDDKKKTFYEIKDNLLRFYFTYIYGIRTLPARLNEEDVYKKLIEPSIETYISKRFEVQVREYFKRSGGLEIEDIGSYWHDDPKTKKNGEFDCAIKKNGKYGLYEAKYLKSPMTEELYLTEKNKIKNAIGINIDFFGFVSSSGFDFATANTEEFITGEMLYNLPI